MPCRVCNGKITRDQAASGVCPYCGTALRAARAATALPPRRGEVRGRKAAVPKASGGSTKWVIGGAIAASVLLLGVAGFAVVRAMRGGETEIVNTQIEIAKSPALPAEVEPAPVAPAVETVAMPEAPKAAEPQPANAPQSNVAELLRQQQILQREDIVKRVDEALQLVNKVGYGHVVVGQIKMNGKASPRDVIAQMEILEDGYFVDAVATAEAPIYFWYQGYNRLDVVPHGLPKSVENLGTVTMVPLTKPLPKIQGRIVASNLSEIENMVPKIIVKVPFVNRCCVDDYNARLLFEKELVTRLNGHFQPEIEMAADGAFELRKLPESTVQVQLDSAQDGRWDHQFDLISGDTFDLGDCPVGHRQFRSVERTMVLQPPAEDGAEDLATLLNQMPKKTKEEFEPLLQTARAAVEECRAKKGEDSAVLIFGQVQPERRDKLHILSQMKILQGGYFVAAVKPGYLVGFRQFGYEPVDYIPKGNQTGVESCGKLMMSKIPESEYATLEIEVLDENGRPLESPYSAAVKQYAENVNWWNGSGNYEGTMDDTVRSIANQRKATIETLPPQTFAIEVNAAGYIRGYANTALARKGENRVRFQLAKPRRVVLRQIAIDENAHELLSMSQCTEVLIDAERDWFPFGELSRPVWQGGYLRFHHERDVVALRSANSPYYILDLGPGDIREFALQKFTFDCAKHTLGYRSVVMRYLVKPGRIYLLQRASFEEKDSPIRTVLFQLDSVIVTNQ